MKRSSLWIIKKNSLVYSLVFRMVLWQTRPLPYFSWLAVGPEPLALSKITFIFILALSLVWAAMLPVIISGLLYYLLNPNMILFKRKTAILWFPSSFLFFWIAVLLIWGLAVVIPSVQRQVVSFFHNLPTYLEKANATIDDFLDNRVSSDIKPQLDEITKELSANITSTSSDLRAAVNWPLTRSEASASHCCLWSSCLLLSFIFFRDGKI